MLAPSCVVIDEWLSCPEMRAAAAAFSSHPQMPPWAPGSGLLACLLPSSHGGQGARPLGGTGELIQALLRALAASGGNKCGSPVREILVRSGRVSGVALDSGEKIEADYVVSTIDREARRGALAAGIADCALAESAGGKPIRAFQRRRNQSGRGA